MSLNRKVTVPVVIRSIPQRMEERHVHNMTFSLFVDEEPGEQLRFDDASAQAGVTAVQISLTDLFEVLHELGYKDANLGKHITVNPL